MKQSREPIPCSSSAFDSFYPKPSVGGGGSGAVNELLHLECGNPSAVLVEHTDGAIELVCQKLRPMVAALRLPVREDAGETWCRSTALRPLVVKCGKTVCERRPRWTCVDIRKQITNEFALRRCFRELHRRGLHPRDDDRDDTIVDEFDAMTLPTDEAETQSLQWCIGKAFTGVPRGVRSTPGERRLQKWCNKFDQHMGFARELARDRGLRNCLAVWPNDGTSFHGVWPCGRASDHLTFALFALDAHRDEAVTVQSETIEVGVEVKQIAFGFLNGAQERVLLGCRSDTDCDWLLLNRRCDGDAHCGWSIEHVQPSRSETCLLDIRFSAVLPGTVFSLSTPDRLTLSTCDAGSVRDVQQLELGEEDWRTIASTSHPCLVAACGARSVRVFDVRSGGAAMNILATGDTLQLVDSFSSAPNVVVVAGDRCLRLFDQRKPGVVVAEWDHMLVAPPVFLHLVDEGERTRRTIVVGSREVNDVHVFAGGGSESFCCETPLRLTRPTSALNWLGQHSPMMGGKGMFISTRVRRITSAPLRGLTTVVDGQGFSAFQLLDSGGVFYERFTEQCRTVDEFDVPAWTGYFDSLEKSTLGDAVAPVGNEKYQRVVHTMVRDVRAVSSASGAHRLIRGVEEPTEPSTTVRMFDRELTFADSVDGCIDPRLVDEALDDVASCQHPHLDYGRTQSMSSTLELFVGDDDDGWKQRGRRDVDTSGTPMGVNWEVVNRDWGARDDL